MTSILAMEEGKHHIGEKCQEYGCNTVMERSLRLEEEFKWWEFESFLMEDRVLLHPS